VGSARAQSAADEEINPSSSVASSVIHSVIKRFIRIKPLERVEPAIREVVLA
jgi:hypothetical protein